MTQFPHRILFAADGSAESDMALHHTVDLLGHTQAEVHVVHVGLVSPWTNPDAMNPTQQARLRAEGQVVLDAQVAKFEAAGITPTATYLRMGRATDEILRLRDEVEADLIILGSRGLNAFKRVLLGSDAEGVVRHAPCPVLVVRKDR
ncbi:universal stress protein [Ornithinimicrobium sediminis]|uniref:universal stress protein n=1 Tax=Ornithinimicrobium sediminis TaxID=2904603 RepID=UPI001E2E8BD2|nr:universal stress protein [Ornithinimicrobium sediminis]MCE0486087.1 universal stress protein [Ornithinimicrobium sediminis]